MTEFDNGQSTIATPPADSPAGRVKDEIERYRQGLMGRVAGVVAVVFLFVVGVAVWENLDSLAGVLLVVAGILLMIAVNLIMRDRARPHQYCPQCGCRFMPRVRGMYDDWMIPVSSIHVPRSCPKCGGDLTISDGRIFGWNEEDASQGDSND